MAVNYSSLVNKNGTIYNTQTGVGYSSPAQLAADLGVSASAINWGQIQSNPGYQPGMKFGTTPTPAPTSVYTPPAPVQQQQTPPGLAMPPGYAASSPAPVTTPTPAPTPTPTPAPVQQQQPPALYLAADGRTVTDAQGNYVSLDQYKQMTGQTNVPDASLDWSHVTKNPAPATSGGTSQGTATSTLPSTGNPQMDALQEELKKIADQMAANGKIINPNIELTPADVQKFLDEATDQVSPYYKSQIDALKGDLTTNLKYLTDQYNLKTQSDQAAFQKNLGDTRENLAGAGLSFSGIRGQQEQAIQADQQNSLDSAANTAAKNAADAVSQTAQKTGSANLLDLSPPSLSGYTADLSGKGTYNPTRTLSYMNPTTTTGSLQYSQAGDTRSLQDFLQQQEINKRTLSFTGA